MGASFIIKLLSDSFGLARDSRRGREEGKASPENQNHTRVAICVNCLATVKEK